MNTKLRIRLVQFLLLLVNVILCQNVEINADSIFLDGIATINRSYSLPQTTGTAGQVITTDGLGESSWASLSTPSTTGEYVYMIPYVCGFRAEATLPQGPGSSRSEGQYMTSIMIMNPTLDTVSFDRSIILLDAGEETPPESAVVQAPYDTLFVDVLPKFHSIELICTEIDAMMGGGLSGISPPIDGVVILESENILNVSVIYTYFGNSVVIEGNNQGIGVGLGQGQSIDVEKIDPIFIPSN